MKKIISVLLLLAMTLSLTACATFECDLCGEVKSGKKHQKDVFGQKVIYCSDCKDALNELGSIFN